MKIAVTYQDGDIFQHFGHTEFFKIYDIENTDIVKTEIVSTNGSGHGALAQFLHEHSVDTLICGGYRRRRSTGIVTSRHQALWRRYRQGR